MSIEALKNENEELIQESLMELKEQIDRPGKVTYIKESRDKKFDIYSYKLVQGGNKGGIKNKYINQIGPWVEGTQFCDVNGNKLKKEKFEAGETVYLRVPKKNNKEKNESKNIEGKVLFHKNTKDKENRNWKIYSYTFAQGGSIYGVMDKFKSQRGMITDFNNFCDKKGNKLKKESFNKGETIYYKTPNTDIIDPTPEMKNDEITKLTENELYEIYRNSETILNHEDKNGKYAIINGRKAYYTLGKNLENNRTYIIINVEEGDNYISIGRKSGNKVVGIYAEKTDNGIKIKHKGNLTYKNGEFIPKK